MNNKDFTVLYHLLYQLLCFYKAKGHSAKAKG